MQEQGIAIGTTLKVVGKMLADTIRKSEHDHRKKFITKDYSLVYVKDGVANVASPYGCHVRFTVDAPDGQYDISYNGGLAPTRQVIFGPMNTHLEFPYDPELIRPPFEKLTPLCQLTPTVIMEILPFIRAAKDSGDHLMIEKGGMGFSKVNDQYIEYPFGVQKPLKINPLFLEIAFTDGLRFPSIEMYQEIRPEELESKEGPTTPLVIGYGWKNCTLIRPIVDAYRSYYS